MVQNHEKAVVVGAGMAGLVTARVLSDYFKEVIIVERDTFPEEPVDRAGVPQSFHPHRMLPRGQMILEQFFPGFIDDMLDKGAQPAHQERSLLVNQYGTIEAQATEKSASSSRALLEWVIRERVKQLKNVHILSDTEVTGLTTSDDQQTITGIKTKERSGPRTEDTLPADLVVDTAGRTSKASRWLEALGYSIPEAERLNVSLGYSTRYYRIPEHMRQDWKLIMSDADPEKGTSTSLLMRIEHHIVMALLFSAGGKHYPSTDPEQFLEEIKDVQAKGLDELLNQLEPLQGPRGYRIQESVRNHFEQMEKWPAGLLVLGDALCSFDPIYGQGMTVGAIEAETLGTCLKEQLSNPQPDFERRVFQRIQKAIAPAWWLSSISDLRWDGVEHSDAHVLQGAAFAQKYINLYSKKSHDAGFRAQ